MKILKRKLFIPIVSLLVIGGTGGGIYFLQPQLLPFGNAQAAQTPEPAENRRAGSGPIYTLKERVLNLKSGESFRYLKIAVALEFDGKEDLSRLKGEEYKKKQEEFAHQIAPKVPLLNDAITTIMTTKNPNELATAEGKEQLREELKAKFNSFLDEPKVVRVYFTEFVMQ